MTGMEVVFIPVRLLRQTPPCFVLLNLGRGTVLMVIAELTILTVLEADSTKLAACTQLIVELEELEPSLN